MMRHGWKTVMLVVNGYRVPHFLMCHQARCVDDPEHQPDGFGACTCGYPADQWELVRKAPAQ